MWGSGYLKISDSLLVHRLLWAFYALSVYAALHPLPIGELLLWLDQLPYPFKLDNDMVS